MLQAIRLCEPEVDFGEGAEGGEMQMAGRWTTRRRRRENEVSFPRDANKDGNMQRMGNVL